MSTGSWISRSATVRSPRRAARGDGRGRRATDCDGAVAGAHTGKHDASPRHEQRAPQCGQQRTGASWVWHGSPGGSLSRYPSGGGPFPGGLPALSLWTRPGKSGAGRDCIVRAFLAPLAPRVSPSMRASTPRLVAIRAAAAPPGVVAVTAVVNDGGLVDYPIALLLVHQGSRLLVSGLGGA